GLGAVEIRLTFKIAAVDPRKAFFDRFAFGVGVKLKDMRLSLGPKEEEKKGGFRVEQRKKKRKVEMKFSKACNNCSPTIGKFYRRPPKTKNPRPRPASARRRKTNFRSLSAISPH